MDIPSRPPLLKGTLITLQPIEPKNDAPEFYDIMKDPLMHKWTGNRVPEDVEETEKLLHKHKTFDGLIAWTIRTNDGGEMVGTYWIALAVVENRTIVTNEAQRIGRKYWRKGYTREARKLVYQYAFFELGAEEIHAQAWADNVNSCRSMESAGFELVVAEEKEFSKYNRCFIQNHYVLYRNSSSFPRSPVWFFGGRE